MTPKKKANRKSYPGHLEQRGAGWRWEVWVAGQRHRIQLRVPTKAEAEDQARNQYAKLAAAARRYEAGAPAPVRMSELFSEYEDIGMPPNEGGQNAYRDSIKILRPYFVERLGDPRADRISRPDIERFLEWRSQHTLAPLRRGMKDPGVLKRMRKRAPAPRTIAKDRAVLHRIFEKAKAWGYAEHNPVSPTEVPKGDDHEPVILTDDEFERLLDACRSPMVRLYVLMLGEVGGRSEAEILWLEWKDVDLERGFLHIRGKPTQRQPGKRRTKSGRGRFAPMTLRLQVALREHVGAYQDIEYATGPSPWVFHHLLTQRHHRAGERIRSCYDAIKGAAKRAGLAAEFRPHDLRHRRVTTWIAEGKDVALIQEAVGHASLKTTRGYTHLAKEHLRALVEDRAPAPARPVLHRSSDS